MNFVNPLWVGLIGGTLLFVLSLESLYVIDTTRQKLKEDSLVNILLLSSDKYYENIVKIGLSPKKNFFLICFKESPLKMMKNAFYCLKVFFCSLRLQQRLKFYFLPKPIMQIRAFGKMVNLYFLHYFLYFIFLLNA